MARDRMFLFLFLLFGTKLVSSVRAEFVLGEFCSTYIYTHYFALFYVDTLPANGSVVEIIDGRATDLLCQFNVPFESEFLGPVRWFLNEVEVVFTNQAQFQGIQLTARSDIGEGVEGLFISSTLSVLATLDDLPLDLNGGRISCFPGNETNPFGLFKTALMLTNRTG